ncbi:nucleotidyltransferase domain-containing protein [Candidatus Pacearchaeota archaeon]|nr:nucleotidyltransferase domain-containing protein [Candidatus Pacearchaeota archaeon]
MSNMLLNAGMLGILEEFCLDYTKKIYGRQIANKLKMNQKTVSNIFNRLEKDGVLKYSTEGKNKYYFLNMLNPQIKDIIKMLEIARKNKFIEKHAQLKDLFYALERRATGILVIFGSYAKFTNKKESDLDVFVAGSMEEIEDLENLYKIKINAIKSSKEKINKNDIFVKEVIKNHIIIKGVEEFVEAIWQA